MGQIAVAAVMLVAGAYKGYQAKKLKEEEAKGLQEAAVRQMAITSREMSEEIRNKELMHSRAIAVAGLSGAGTDGLTKLLGDLNTEGEYRIMSVLWNGQNEAEGLQYRAEAARREGKAAQTAGWIDGITSAVSAYVGMGGKGDPGIKGVDDIGGTGDLGGLYQDGTIIDAPIRGTLPSYRNYA